MTSENFEILKDRPSELTLWTQSCPTMYLNFPDSLLKFLDFFICYSYIISMKSEGESMLYKMEGKITEVEKKNGRYEVDKGYLAKLWWNEQPPALRGTQTSLA